MQFQPPPGFDPSAVEVQDGSRAIEVTAMFEDADRRGRATSRTRRRATITGRHQGAARRRRSRRWSSRSSPSSSPTSRSGAVRKAWEAWDAAGKPHNEFIVPREGPVLDILVRRLHGVRPLRRVPRPVPPVLGARAARLHHRSRREHAVQRARRVPAGRLVPAGALDRHRLRAALHAADVGRRHGQRSDDPARRSWRSRGRRAQSGEVARRLRVADPERRARQDRPRAEHLPGLVGAAAAHATPRRSTSTGASRRTPARPRSP